MPISMPWWSKDFTAPPPDVEAWHAAHDGRAYASDAPALPVSVSAQQAAISAAAALTGVPVMVVADHAMNGLQTQPAALYEAAVQAALTGRVLNPDGIPADVQAAMVGHAQQADRVVGQDRPVPGGPSVGGPDFGFSLSDLNPVKAAKKIAEKAVDVVTNPIDTATDAVKTGVSTAASAASAVANPIDTARSVASSGARATADAARSTAHAIANPLDTAGRAGSAVAREVADTADIARDLAVGTYHVGKYVFGPALHPSQTWNAGINEITRLPGRARDLGAESWDTLKALASGELAEELVRAIIRTALKPLLQVMVTYVQVATKNTLPEMVAIGGAAAIARLAGAGLAVDPRRLLVAEKLAKIGADHLVHQVLGLVPEPPNVGPLKARDVWRSKVRRPVEAGLSQAIALGVVAIGTGKAEDVLSAIAGIGVLSWATVSTKKILDFLIAEAIGATATYMIGKKREQVTSLLDSINVPPSLTLDIIDAFKPVPSV